jgi:predicted RNase H-like nuclease (RuvC/YqgF family)
MPPPINYHPLVLTAKDLVRSVTTMAKENRKLDEQVENLKDELYELKDDLDYHKEQINTHVKNVPLEKIFTRLCKKYHTNKIEITYHKGDWWGVSIDNKGDEGLTILLAVSDIK